MRMIRLSTNKTGFTLGFGKFLDESLAVAFKPILILCKSLLSHHVYLCLCERVHRSVRTHTCMVYFVTYLILCFMYLQLGSVCEGILWSDSQPAEEEREDEEGGSQRQKVRERKKSKKKRGRDSTFNKLSQTVFSCFQS